MKLFGYELRKASRRVKSSPAYPSSIINRLNEDFPIMIVSADSATRWSLRELRARSQQLEREKGGIGERYLACVETNVIGADGIGLQLKINDAAGNFDDDGSDLVEQAWQNFCELGQFEVTGEHSAQNFDRVSVRSVARDGDLLQLCYRGSAVGEQGIAFQLLEGQYLDEQHNVARMPNGNQIRMGVELDQFKRKVAFWVLARHPGDYGIAGNESYDGKRRRIPAIGVDPAAPVSAIHVTRTKRPEETRGVPWLTPAIEPIAMLAGYEEAELVAARAQACKHVFFERQAFAPDGTPLDYGDATTGELTEEMEPGGATDLPIGYRANFYNPTHPSAAFEGFTKDFRRKIAASLSCAYNTLFTDLEGVNFSSIRAGLLDEREQWKMSQNWYVAAAKQRQFEAWLNIQLMLGRLKGFGMRDFDRIRRATDWKCRRWTWVDPWKDIQAARAAVEAKLTSRTAMIADHYGEDFEDTIDQIAQEHTYIESLGLDPLIAEPKASEQLVDTAEQPNAPDAVDSPVITGEDSPPDVSPNAATPAVESQHHSARQPRQGGRFAGPPAPVTSPAQGKDMDFETIKALIEASKNNQPNVTVNMPPPVVNIEALTVSDRPPPVINVQVPETAAPVINLPASQIDVHVPVNPAPIVKVENRIERLLPPKEQRLAVVRDDNGKITGLEMTKE